MKIATCFTGLILVTLILATDTPVAHSAPACVQQTASETSATTDPAEKLSEAVDLAESGDTTKAFSVAKAVKQESTPDRFFSVNYVNTLLTIAEQKDDRLDAKILNEAISEVNQIRATKLAAGDQDPEIAYHFMVATGRLADALLPRDENIASRLMAEEGSIATKLKSNPLYPRDSLASLSEPVFSKAQACAIQGKEAEAIQCLQEAFRLGFVKFDEVASDEHLAKLQDQKLLKRINDQAEEDYREKTRIWSGKELAQFKRFAFKLDVKGLDGNRMTQGDFEGKILVIDLWATWCSPCREGIPHFIHLHDDYQAEGVEVIGVSMDNPEDPASARDTVKDFTVENKVNYTCAMGDNSVTDQIEGKQLLPTTLFVDRTGTCRYLATGYHDYYQLEAITKALASESEAISTHRVH